MSSGRGGKPDSTAVRVALWRALHVELDPPPHVLSDTIGLRMIAPAGDWRRRPDMNPKGTRRFRASVVIRARFVEDLVRKRMSEGVRQYVILGAGLDTFAQREKGLCSRLDIYEIDQPGTLAWKEKRLIELGYDLPDRLHRVPVDFEADEGWWPKLLDAGFQPELPAVVAATGVSMYLTKEAIKATLSQVARLAAGSTLAMTFLLPAASEKGRNRKDRDAAEKGAKASRTPFVSFFEPGEMLDLARDAGFSRVEHIAGSSLTKQYFPSWTGQDTVGSAEEMLVACTT